MKRNKRNKGAIWDYLEELGVLENGTDEEIKAAKKAYRKKYFLKYKREQRKAKPEFNVCFSEKNGEYSKVKRAAQRHRMTMTAFIRSSVLGYLGQTYVVPNESQIAHLEQILSDCLNEIQKLVGIREKYHWEREQKFEAIEKRIERLETDINQVLRHPPQQQHDYQNQIFQETKFQETS